MVTRVLFGAMTSNFQVMVKCKPLPCSLPPVSEKTIRSGFTISRKIFWFGYFVPSGPCMTCFHEPPGRKSISSMVVEKPLGPHQFTTCFGLEKASHTSSRGAVTSRVIMISRLEVTVVDVVAVIDGLFR